MGKRMVNVMTLASAFRLATSPQQAWAGYGAAVRQVLSAADHLFIAFGVAGGYADPAAPANRLTT